MRYQAELDFLCKSLKKMRLQSTLLYEGEAPNDWPDMGLRKFLGCEDEYERTLRSSIRQAKPNTIYKLTDPYLCNYISLVLPDTNRFTYLAIGPYVAFPLTRQQIMEKAEALGVPPAQFRQLEGYYSHLPILSDETSLLVMVNTFAECLWGEGNAYEIVDINQDMAASPSTRLSAPDNIQDDDILLQMKVMEQRYAYENELMEMVSKGLVHRAELLVGNASQISVEPRLTDPLRNMKNYCIVCNTLLRKAAEQGGVHPIYLNDTSSAFAREIESVSSLQLSEELMLRMIRSYCRLVKKHSTQQYSSPVQKAVTCIDSDLSQDLSLAALAAAQGINASYLSALFKKETSQTVTDYVNRKRTEEAAHLLTTTKLQVQTIAQHCGISDVNYFSKLFKKYKGLPPKEFRSRMQPSFPEKK